jgi:glycosyltransferase involved in cell wall biosynthesis
VLSLRVAELVQAVISLAPLAGLVARPPERPEGITAGVRARGEEEWIEPCLLSVKEFADEVLLLDNGASARVRERVRRLAPSLGAAFRALDCTGLDIVALCNRGLEESRRHWFCLWDADLVAHTEGPYAVQKLRRYLMALDRHRYHVVNIATRELAGDLRHRLFDLAIRFDPHVMTVGGGVRYVWGVRQLSPHEVSPVHRTLRGDEATAYRIRYDTPRIPRYYQMHRWTSPSLLHVNVKSARRMLLRHFWQEWLASGSSGDLESFARERVRERWGLESLEAAEAPFMAEYCRYLVPVAEAEMGGYPRLLDPFLRVPTFRVLYRDGRIIGRAEAEP